MSQHLQYLTARNPRGARLLAAAAPHLELHPPASSGSRRAFVAQTVLADDEAKMGRAPAGPPRWLGELLATVLTWLGPKGLEFARYSIDYHYCRNVIHVSRHWGGARAARHIPEFARRIAAEYDRDGAVSKR
jgi:7-hydroxymethyl chlorophyll a reductase